MAVPMISDAFISPRNKKIISIESMIAIIIVSKTLFIELFTLFALSSTITASRFGSASCNFFKVFLTSFERDTVLADCVFVIDTTIHSSPSYLPT